MRFRLFLTVLLLVATPVMAAEPSVGLKRGLIAHWPLSSDAKGASGNGRDLTPRGEIEFTSPGPGGKATAARFDGKTSYLEIPARNLPAPASADFTCAMWVQTPDVAGDVLG